MRFRSLRKDTLLFAIAIIAILFCATAARAQSSSFTYQGRLTDGGTAANGNYDLQFALWDSLSGGNQIGSTRTVNTVAVSNGIFTVSLDFGASAFNGASRFLEISARPSGGSSFTLLTPRQPITSTPYAVRSLNAASADSVPASGVPAGSGNYIQNSGSPQTANFSISGNGTAGGTLSGNVVNATTQYNLNGSHILSNPGSNNLFAGRFAGNTSLTGLVNSVFGNFSGQAITDGDANSFFGGGAGNATNTGSFNAFFGIDTGRFNTTGLGNSFFGSQAGGGNITGRLNTLIGYSANVGSSSLVNATAIGFCARVTQSNSLILGGENCSAGNDIIDHTKVGIGTTAPTKLFHLKGAGSDSGGNGDLLVTGTGTVGAAITFESTGTGGGKYSWISTANSADPGGGKLAAFDVIAGAYRMVIDSGGNIGIGTNSPTATLSVNGTANKPGGGSWGVFSDERLKNIEGRFTPGLRAVMQLQPLRYEYKRDNALNLKSEGEYVGFSAQAVQKIIPEAVTSTEQGYLLVNNDPILWTMLNAIKEQQAQIAKLQQVNSTLNTRLHEVEKALRKKLTAPRRR